MFGRGYRKWVAAETESFRLEADNWGNFTLIRFADATSLFFQGGDAVEIASEIETDGFNLDAWADAYVGTVKWDDALPPAPPELLVIA
jgi:hypothetical protein